MHIPPTGRAAVTGKLRANLPMFGRCSVPRPDIIAVSRPLERTSIQREKISYRNVRVISRVVGWNRRYYRARPISFRTIFIGMGPRIDGKAAPLHANFRPYLSMQKPLIVQ